MLIELFSKAIFCFRFMLISECFFFLFRRFCDEFFFFFFFLSIEFRGGDSLRVRVSVLDPRTQTFNSEIMPWRAFPSREI